MRTLDKTIPVVFLWVSYEASNCRSIDGELPTNDATDPTVARDHMAYGISGDSGIILGPSPLDGREETHPGPGRSIEPSSATGTHPTTPSSALWGQQHLREALISPLTPWREQDHRPSRTSGGPWALLPKLPGDPRKHPKKAEKGILPRRKKVARRMPEGESPYPLSGGRARSSGRVPLRGLTPCPGTPCVGTARTSTVVSGSEMWVPTTRSIARSSGGVTLPPAGRSWGRSDPSGYPRRSTKRRARTEIEKGSREDRFKGLWS
jgi:hypothetical protein